MAARALANANGRIGMRAVVLVAAAAVAAGAAVRHTSPARLPGPLYYEVPCPAGRASAAGVMDHEVDPEHVILPGCSPGVPYTAANGSIVTPPCGRYIEDDFLSESDVSTLLSMVEKAFAYSTVVGGPAIMDVNSGFLRDAHGMLDIYSGRNRRAPGAPPLARRKKPLGRARAASAVEAIPVEPTAEADQATGKDKAKAKYQPVRFSPEEYALYGSVFERIHGKIMSIFGLEQLWFTAPTFVARILGDAGHVLQPSLVVKPGQAAEDLDIQAVWSPDGPHDEYWHPHADQANTGHYHWSGLVYLSSQLEDGHDEGSIATSDFTGGGFAFLQHGNGTASEALTLTPDLGDDRQWQDQHTVGPRAGRLLLFSSGQENIHTVRRVTSGVRYLFSMWFTCDARREFGTFLDGKAHTSFGVKGKKERANDNGDAAGRTPAPKEDL